MLRSVWLLFLIVFSSAHADDPFWKSKAKVYERVQQGEVIVSVNAHDITPKKPHMDLDIKGGGHVPAPCSFVYAESRKYEQVARYSDYVKEAKFNPDTNQMRVKISAFGFSRELTMAITVIADRDTEFRLLDGPMPGFWWRSQMTEFKPGVCEIAMTGGYKYDEFPIPRFFLEFGMEVIFKRMAQQMRSHVMALYHGGKTAGQGDGRHERILSNFMALGE